VQSPVLLVSAQTQLPRRAAAATTRLRVLPLLTHLLLCTVSSAPPHPRRLCKADWSGHSSCANFSASPASPENVKVADAQKSDFSKPAHLGQHSVWPVENFPSLWLKSRSCDCVCLHSSPFTARSELKKYMHYWSRFDNHAKSIKFAQKTRAAAEERMAQLQAIKGTGLLDVQFLVDASDTVIRNKRILQWLYVYGYFFDAPEGSSDRALFELHQATVRTRASDSAPAALNMCMAPTVGSDHVAFTHTLAHLLCLFRALFPLSICSWKSSPTSCTD
jgi:hypothetical protein